MKISVKKLDPKAILPSFAHPGDAGMDIFALEKTVIKPGERLAIRTGIAVELPEGYAALIWDKSGIAIRDGLKVLGGVIDAGYRGEYKIGMINLSDKEYIFEAGHKVAQILIQKVESFKVEEVDELSETKRGANGFGSTGK